ncbi:MAG: pyruvate:ferredoxin (flavodoxin) oxidoreductase, partial [Lentisphaerae bacterium]|nr:pyruvate:ferredoxin (flavodoxin) oxidoreductase [Lentisphaerota bacterium]
VMDMALIAHAATLESRIPFLHFFDGFRTSHEVQKIEEVDDSVVREMIDDKFVFEHRARGLTPDRPKLRGTAQNPDVYFQGRETANPYYNATPEIVQKCMDKFAGLTGRKYKLFDYVGAPDAEHIVIAMGSGIDTVHETVDRLLSEGEKVGLVKIRLYRPFSISAFTAALPDTVKTITVLDRVKEPGSIGDPLYLDVRTAIGEMMEEDKTKFSRYPRTIAGRYGLGSKDFTPAMVQSIFDNAKSASPKKHFTVGINDDVTNTSLEYDKSFVLNHKGRKECMFYGLGSDGTVGANKNSIKIIGDETDNFAQGYFEYDSKKSGGITVSHLRFGPEPIQSPYFCTNADFIACHNFSFVEKYDMLVNLKEGGTFLLASPFSADEVWDHLPDELEQQIIDKKAKFYVINAVELAEKMGMGSRINTIMQTAFFKIANILPADEAIELLKQYAKAAYGRKGDDVVKSNWDAIDAARDALYEVNYPSQPSGKKKMPPIVPAEAPEFVQNVTAKIIAQKGDDLPVSAMPNDGTWPVATTQWEKRNVATQIPRWDPETCIQCTTCSLVCPHAAIRGKVYEEKELEGAPPTFKSADAKTKEFAGKKFTIQVAPEDCIGCGACVYSCPMKAKGAIKMTDQLPLREPEAENFKFFMDIPDYDRSLLNLGTIKGSQLCRPLFEFSGACAGCGETPYIKLMTQLLGDRAIIANATGCTSIYGGNLPTTPYCTREDGRGPAWSNSLFEDNAQFGLGMYMTVEKFNSYALELIEKLLASDKTPDDVKAIATEIRGAQQETSQEIEEQRKRVATLKEKLENVKCDVCEQLLSISDYLVRKSVWILGGDGWAYDIGYGGLDHVLASGKPVKVLVLDTEVYSNTGGQASKSTPLGAVAKFATAGKPQQKKDLGMISMTYGNIYVAQVAMGANTAQTVRAFNEAEAYDGPALIIAYSHCINHGMDMETGMFNQKVAVESGHFPLYRFNPDNVAQGKNPLTIDSRPPTRNFSEQVELENRFKMLNKTNPEEAARMVEEADKNYKSRYKLLQQIAAMTVSDAEAPEA